MDILFLMISLDLTKSSEVRKAGDRYTTYSKEGSRILPRLFAMACFATHIHFLLITSSKKKLGLHALNRKSKNETAL